MKEVVLVGFVSQVHPTVLREPLTKEKRKFSMAIIYGREQENQQNNHPVKSIL